VIETIAQESPVLQRLPFIEIVGNGLTYNRENVAPSADFYDVGDDWDESTPTFTQATATLKILGGDADIDNFLKSTRSNIQDLEAAVVQLKARAVQSLFDDTFVNGDEGVDAKSFDGIDALCAVGQTATMGTNGGTLTLEKLDARWGRGRAHARRGVPRAGSLAGESARVGRPPSHSSLNLLPRPPAAGSEGSAKRHASRPRRPRAAR
jgi:hypothetical protein